MIDRLHRRQHDHAAALCHMRRHDDVLQPDSHVQRVVEDLVGQLRLVAHLLTQRAAHRLQHVDLRVVHLQVLSTGQAPCQSPRVEEATLRARNAANGNHMLPTVGGILGLQLAVALEDLLQMVLHLLDARLRIIGIEYAHLLPLLNLENLLAQKLLGGRFRSLRVVPHDLVAPKTLVRGEHAIAVVDGTLVGVLLLVNPTVVV